MFLLFGSGLKPHAGRFSLNNMTTITFGFRTDSIDHPFVHKALRLNREFMSVAFLRPTSNSTCLSSAGTAPAQCLIW